MTQRISLSPDSTPARSALACLEAHEADARRLCCSNTVPASAYRLTPEDRARLFAAGILREAAKGGTKGACKVSVETVARMSALRRSGATLESIAQAYGVSVNFVHRHTSAHSKTVGTQS